MKGIARVILFFASAATGAVAMQSCSNDDVMQVATGKPISFRMVMDRPTKAVSYTQTNLQSFNVTALTATNSSVYVDQVDYSTSDYSVWTSDQKYYWPSGGGNLVFYAYAPKVSAGNGVARNSHKSFTVTPLADTDNQVDLVFARTTSAVREGVSLNFRHVMTQVAVKFKNSNPNVYFHVKGWKIAGVKGTGTFTYDDADDTSTQASTVMGTTTNTVAAACWTDWGNSCSYTKILASGYKEITSDANSWGYLEAGSSAILVPQPSTIMAMGYADTDNNPSTPNVLDGSYIAILYDLYNASGDLIKSSATWGCWPVVFEWEPGYRYNYTVDLADMGYSETGDDELEAFKDGSKVLFVGLTVDSWAPDGGSEIDLPLADITPTPAPAVTPYLRFHTDEGIQELYMDCEPYADTYYYDDGMDMYCDVYDFYYYSDATGLEYSLDEGATWQALNSSAHGYYDDFDDYTNKVSFGPNANGDGKNIDLLIRGNSGFHCSMNGFGYDTEYALNYNSYYYNDYFPYFGFTKNYSVSCTGAVTSLTDYNNIDADLTYDYQYAGLFYNCECLVSAPDLPSAVLTEGCYRNMFDGCSHLASLPSALPSISVTNYCYSSMFANTAITSIPSGFLPATSMAYMCYYCMFYNCASLVTVPVDLLPAESLYDYCYNGMFRGCSSLQNAPDLPAMTLAAQCYYGMFQGCSSLTTAPDLPALYLPGGAYQQMFYGCSSLKSVKAMFTGFYNQYSYRSWLSGVPNTTDGVFTKNSAATWSNSTIGVPSNWQVVLETP